MTPSPPRASGVRSAGGRGDTPEARGEGGTARAPGGAFLGPVGRPEGRSCGSVFPRDAARAEPALRTWRPLTPAARDGLARLTEHTTSSHYTSAREAGQGGP